MELDGCGIVWIWVGLEWCEVEWWWLAVGLVGDVTDWFGDEMGLG